MQIDVKDKYFWFVFFELVCGFVASIAWVGYWVGGNVKIDNSNVDVKVDSSNGDVKVDSSNGNHDTYNVLHGIMISGGFFPTFFRLVPTQHFY